MGSNFEFYAWPNRRWSMPLNNWLCIDLGYTYVVWKIQISGQKDGIVRGQPSSYIFHCGSELHLLCLLLWRVNVTIYCLAHVADASTWKMTRVSDLQWPLRFVWCKIELNIGLAISLDSDSSLDSGTSSNDDLRLSNSDSDKNLDSSSNLDGVGNPWELEGQPSLLLELTLLWILRATMLSVQLLQRGIYLYEETRKKCEEIRGSYFIYESIFHLPKNVQY